MRSCGSCGGQAAIALVSASLCLAVDRPGVALGIHQSTLKGLDFGRLHRCRISGERWGSEERCRQCDEDGSERSEHEELGPGEVVV